MANISFYLKNEEPPVMSYQYTSNNASEMFGTWAFEPSIKSATLLYNKQESFAMN